MAEKPKHRFSRGQSVRFASLVGTRVFRGVIVSFIGDGFYCMIDDGTGLRPRPVRVDRLEAFLHPIPPTQVFA